MKKILLFILLALFFKFGFSQNSGFENENLIGIRAGYGAHMINNEYALVNDSLLYAINGSNYGTGITTGLSYKNFLQKNVGTVFGLYYTEKGGYSEFYYDKNFEAGEVAVPILFYHHLEYIEFQIMMNIRLGKKHSKFNIYMGNSVSYLYKQKLTLKQENVLEKDYKMNTDYKFEFGINVGAGYAFSFNKGEVELNFLYSHSLTNIFEAQLINASLFNQTQLLAASLYYYYKF